MKTFLIQSNHGNHSGFNVKWTLSDVCSSKKEAHEALINASLNLNDNHIIRNGRAYDTENKEYVCTNKDDGFSYDGVRYMLITKNDLDDFNGGNLGYLPTSIINELTEDN